MRLRYQPARQRLVLLLISLGAVLVHGYHPAVEDAEIYLPGIKRVLNPSLYPYNDGFFASHASRTFFPNLIAASVRLTHLPLDYTLLLWHVLSIFLLLLACWKISRICFHDIRAQVGSVTLVAALLTLPVAGTALYIVDQYLNTRSLSTPAVMFAVASALEGKRLQSLLWIIFTGLIHPLMVVFGFAFILLMWVVRRVSSPSYALVLFPLVLAAPSEAYRETLNMHSYFFLLRWQWYEWVGIFAPLGIFLWVYYLARGQRPQLRLVAATAIWFGLLSFLAGVIITIPSRFAGLTLLQPMRALHLLYILLLTLAGGLLGMEVLQEKAWRWILLLLPLCGIMCYVQRQTFPATPHLELPWTATGNDWVRAFLWIRNNTPPDAYFALDPRHMELPGEDQHGFRAIAERSMLADRVKDSGAVTMFPGLAQEWKRQVQAQDGWQSFRLVDFLRLRYTFGVNWVVLERPGLIGLDCPYSNKTVLVCRIE